jgi:Tfp pilus assembly pilus retraction ATPase PilT
MMKTYLIHPEVFYKYLTSDAPKELDSIEKVFIRAERGKIKLLITEGLFFLLAQELEKIVKNRSELVDLLEAVLNLHNLKVRNEMVLRQTVLEMKRGKSFVESYKSVVLPALSLDGVIEC